MLDFVWLEAPGGVLAFGVSTIIATLPAFFYIDRIELLRVGHVFVSETFL